MGISLGSVLDKSYCADEHDIWNPTKLKGKGKHPVYSHADQKRCDDASLNINKSSFHMILNIQPSELKRNAEKFSP